MDNPIISLEGLRRFLEDLRLNSVQVEDGKGLSSNDLTDKLKSDYDAAAAHAKSLHAPVDAEPNVIENIIVHGNTLPVENKTVDIPVPRNMSELNNDLGLLTGHPKTPTSSDTSSNNTPGYKGTFQVVKNIDKDTNGHIKRVDIENVTLPSAYDHPNSGVSPSTYRSITVNEKGHVTEGTNPVTRDGYGLTDVPTTKEMNIAITAAIGTAEGLTREVVTVLPPTSSANPLTIYLIPKSKGISGNNYDEYIIVNGSWEKLGDQGVDLSGYLQEADFEEVTITEIDALFNK